MKFIKILITASSIAVAACSPIPAAANELYFGDDSPNPSLRTNGFCGFDWYSVPNLQKQREVLTNMGTIKIQSRFQWQGWQYNLPALKEHTVLALTQDTYTNQGDYCNQVWQQYLNSPAQPTQQWLHKHGAGAILTERGLGLELWNPDKTAWVWDQSNNRCAILAPVGPTNKMCLSSSYNAAGYVTPNPNFVLQRGKFYWVRVTYTGFINQGSAWTQMKAELLEETSSGVIKIQEAMVNFITAQYLPISGTMQVTIARTNPEVAYQAHPVKFWAFDYGF